jgi:GNAT superfamily N-acetyltransferase
MNTMSAPRFSPALLSRIEDASLNASAPPQQRWVDGWLVRLSPGKAQRARSVNAVAEGVLPLPQRLALCQRAFEAAGLPLLYRITPFSKPLALDERLAQAGFEAHDHSLVLVCLGFPAGPFGWPAALSLEAAAPAAYAEVVGAFRGSPLPERQAHADRVAACPVRYQGFVLRDANGTAVACAQLVVEDDMAGLYDVFTAPAWRGQGIAHELCGHLLTLAAKQGAAIGYLQVAQENAAARKVYARLGFVEGYGYHYRMPLRSAAD